MAARASGASSSATPTIRAKTFIFIVGTPTLLLRSEQVFRAKENRLEEVIDLVSESWPDRTFIDAVINRQPTLSPAEIAVPMLDWTAAVLESGAGWELGLAAGEQVKNSHGSRRLNRGVAVAQPGDQFAGRCEKSLMRISATFALICPGLVCFPQT